MFIYQSKLLVIIILVVEVKQIYMKFNSGFGFWKINIF